MAYRFNRGMSAVEATLFNDLFGPGSYGERFGAWVRQLVDPVHITPLAVPPAPTGSALTTPPASGEQAEQLVQELSNEQMRRQQELMAAQVKTSPWWQASSVAVETADVFSAPLGISWLAWGAGAAALVGLVMVSGGGRRRR